MLINVTKLLIHGLKRERINKYIHFRNNFAPSIITIAAAKTAEHQLNPFNSYPFR